MDRPVESTELKRQRLKTYLVAAAIITIIILVFTQFKNLVKPSVKRAAISVDAAELGVMEATIAASGVILPQYEVLITSPISSKIEKVLHRAGEEVRAFEPILQLSTLSSLVALEKLNEEQQVNRNKINQLELGLQKSLNDLQTQYSIKEVRIKSLENAVAHEKSLLEIGGGTEQSVKQAQLNLKVAQLELEQLVRQIANQKAMMKADLKSLGFEINIREKDIDELSSRIQKTAISSPRKGVITWINDEIGAEITKGAELVRIADLSSYKVEATVSDNYANEVSVGRGVIVRLGNKDLRGSIANVQPAIENGTVRFFISLQEKYAQQLRPSRVRTAQANKKLIKVSVDQARRDFDQEVITQVRQLNVIKEQMGTNKEAGQTAAERFEIARKRYLLADLSITDLNIALQEKDQARRDYIISLKSFWTSYYNLKVLTLYDFEQGRKLNPEKH